VTWVIAHRGASFDEKENTLPAFERAITLGADFVELDVQASRDGALVVFHDLELDRLSPLHGRLRDQPVGKLREVGIPTLEEVLELVSGRIRLMPELKNPHLYVRHDLVARTVRLLPPDAVVVSFSRRALLESRRIRPELAVLQHVGVGVSIRRAATFARFAGFQDRRVTPRGLARARALGLGTTVYTVNEPSRMRELVELGVDGIFTDRPDLLRSILGRGNRR
jgi:glycerophosphoryl diester phosphodiesterase